MKRFHDNMSVRLRSGLEMDGVRLHSSGLPCMSIDDEGNMLGLSWFESGKEASGVSDLDIVEVLSEPPPQTFEELFHAKALKDGMVFESRKSDGSLLQFSIVAAGNKLYRTVASDTPVDSVLYLAHLNEPNWITNAVLMEDGA